MIYYNAINIEFFLNKSPKLLFKEYIIQKRY